MNQETEQHIQYGLQPILMKIDRTEKITEEQLREMAEQIVTPVLNGSADPLGAFAELKMFAKIAELAMDMIAEDAKVEAQKYTKGQFPSNVYGAKVEYQEGARQYDFKNNPSIVSIEESVKKLKDLAKTIKEPMIFESTGEMIYPAIVTHKKDSIKITFEK